MPMSFWVILAIGVICTAVPAYSSYDKNKGNKKEAVRKTALITICGVVATLTLAIAGSFIYDKIITGEGGESSSTGTTSSSSSSSSAGSISESSSSSIPTSSNAPLIVWIDPNGGTVFYNSINVYPGECYPDLPRPYRDYYTFDGWYTSPEGGNEVIGGVIVNNPNSHTLYAHWKENEVSDWVLESKIPAGVKIVDEKWKYILIETKESTNSYESGWTHTGSIWKQTDTGTHTYADFPSNSDGKVYYNTSDQFYKIYNNGAYKNFENENAKREITNEQVEAYIYYHWVYPLSGNHSENDRIIGSYNGEKIYNKDGTYCGAASIWESFKGGYIEYKPEKKAYKAIGNSTYSYWWSGGIPIYTQSYTDYEKIYLYKRETAIESTSEVVEGGGISNVQKYVKYQEK